MRVQICSDIDYDFLIAELYQGEEFIALVSQEEGADKLKVEFPGQDGSASAASRVLDFSEFFEALALAKERLVGS